MPPRLFLLASLLLCTTTLAAPTTLPSLKISPNGHFLIKSDGSPFFYLGDTAWGLLSHPTLTEADQYLQDRASKGFTVIQTVVLLWDSLNRPNPAGQLPLINRDPTKPNEAWFKDADTIIDNAASRGMYVAVLPIWSKTFLSRPDHMLLDTTTAESFAAFLAARWRDKPIIWILGGDWPGTKLMDINRALAAGLQRGGNGEQGGNAHLITYHPTGRQSSSMWFDHEPWLDFNVLQSGHFIQNHNYDQIAHDYALTPPKPVLDMEPGYENITDRLLPATPTAKRIAASDVRRFGYLSVFAGAAGHTYGCGEVYEFWTKNRPPPRWGSSLPWQQSLQLPGAAQMQYLRYLIESRPMLDRIPDPTMLIGDPGQTTDRIEVTRAHDGAYAFAYSASGQPINLKLDALPSPTLKSWWYDPRTGTAKPIDESPKPATRKFTPPTTGEGNDWVLVLDDPAKHFSPPGLHP